MQGPPPAPALAKEESTYDEGVPDDDDDAVEDDDDDDDFENLMQLTSTKPPAIEPCTRNVYDVCMLVHMHNNAQRLHARAPGGGRRRAR